MIPCTEKSNNGTLNVIHFPIKIYIFTFGISIFCFSSLVFLMFSSSADFFCLITEINLGKIFIFILHTNKDPTNLNLSTRVRLLKVCSLLNLHTFPSPESLQWTYFPVSSVCKLAINYSVMWWLTSMRQHIWYGVPWTFLWTVFQAWDRTEHCSSRLREFVIKVFKSGVNHHTGNKLVKQTHRGQQSHQFNTQGSTGTLIQHTGKSLHH